MILVINFPCPSCGAPPGHLCKNEDLKDQVDQVHISRILLATDTVANLEVDQLGRMYLDSRSREDSEIYN